MNILVTGSYGQLGSELKKIASTDMLHNWYFTDIDTLDICNKTQVEHLMASENIEVCINCAAYTAVDKAEDEPEKAMLINATAPGILAEACAKNNALMVQISTDYVFNGENFKPYNEDDAFAPISSYGRSKGEGEKMVVAQAKRFVIMRTAWLYSATGNNFVKTMIRLGKEKESINVVSDQIGTPTWAFDLAAAIMLVVDKYGKQNIQETFHFTNEGVISWYDFAKAVMSLENLNCQVNPIESKDYPVKTQRPFYSVLNKAKFRKFSGTKIPHWHDSLEKCLKEINSNY